VRYDRYGYAGSQGARRGLGLETDINYSLRILHYIYIQRHFCTIFYTFINFHSEKDSHQDVGSATGCRAHEAGHAGPRRTGGIAFHLRRSPSFRSRDHRVLVRVLQLTRSLQGPPCLILPPHIPPSGLLPRSLPRKDHGLAPSIPRLPWKPPSLSLPHAREIWYFPSSPQSH
jgi:hypothetical protein